MAIYQFNSDPKLSKLNDFSTVISIAFFATIPLLTRLGDKTKLPPEFKVNFWPIMIFLGIFMVCIPFIKLIKRKRDEALKIEATKKGLHITLFESKNIYAWKDLSRSVIIYDILNNKLYPRKIILRHGTTGTAIDNPPYGRKFNDIIGFVKELTDNIPNIRQEVIGLKQFCPWCGPLEHDGKCPKCLGKIEYVPKANKIFYNINIGVLTASIALFFMGGKTYLVVLLTGLLLLLIFIISPVYWLLKPGKNPKTIQN